ncbi:MAG TPA: hypothetical protein VG496_05235 [Myxococcales bacterium]|nr:hypothetical protein [Myxococcales bacterium]
MRRIEVDVATSALRAAVEGLHRAFPREHERAVADAIARLVRLARDSLAQD